MNVSNLFISSSEQNPTGLQLLGKTTLTSATNATITIPKRSYLRIVIALAGKGLADTLGLQFNADAGANYSYRASANGGADATAVSQNAYLVGPISGTVAQLITVDIENIAGPHKQMRHVCTGEIAAPTDAPNRTEGAGYWDGIDQITSVKILSTGGQVMWADVFIYGAD